MQLKIVKIKKTEILATSQLVNTKGCR